MCQSGHIKFPHAAAADDDDNGDVDGDDYIDQLPALWEMWTHRSLQDK